jgi:hypothetical protein
MYAVQDNSLRWSDTRLLDCRRSSTHLRCGQGHRDDFDKQGTDASD